MQELHQPFGAIQRREGLKPYCEVEKVQQNLRIEAYYRKAMLVEKQCEIYSREASWDRAYVMNKRLASLCLHVIPAHQSFSNPPNLYIRAWVKQTATKALVELEKIVREMESEEALEEEEDMAYPIAIQQTTTTTGDDQLAKRLAALRTMDTPSIVVPEQKADLQSRTAALNALRIDAQPPPFPQTDVRYPLVGEPGWIEKAKKENRPSNRKLFTSGLRTLIIPSSTVPQFSRVAEPNTRIKPNGIETCAILAGTLRDERFTITSLVIPKQKGEANMCTMTHEEELFEYCITHDLLTLGWIHTHPSQSCFMSSIDIHTHCGFQTMLPESIAIVLAPTDKTKNVGVFRLTQPDGLQLIQNCTQTGFHEHPRDVTIYSDAMDCQWIKDSPLSVVDLR